jgi:hypothetical protein
MILGHETYVAITPTHTTTRKDLRQLPVSKRKCYFLDEFHLQLFNTYSVKNCWMESLTNFSRFNFTLVLYAALDIRGFYYLQTRKQGKTANNKGKKQSFCLFVHKIVFL